MSIVDKEHAIHGSFFWPRGPVQELKEERSRGSRCKERLATFHAQEERGGEEKKPVTPASHEAARPRHGASSRASGAARWERRAVSTPGRQARGAADALAADVRSKEVASLGRW